MRESTTTPDSAFLDAASPPSAKAADSAAPTEAFPGCGAAVESAAAAAAGSLLMDDNAGVTKDGSEDGATSVFCEAAG